MALSENPGQLLLLVDASSYLYRAYHAMPDLRNSRNEPTGAVYGVVNMLRKLRADYKPTFLAMIFDAPGGTFRDDLYADYKATRAAMPDDLVAQIAPLHDIIRALGVPLLAIPGVEADDVIGTLAVAGRESGLDVVISTGDKDMAQLVGPHITLINTMTDQRLDSDGVVARFGVPPARIIDYLAIVGDKVDNVPGVAGAGPKTAARWLTTYGSLAALLEHAAEIPGRLGETLRASREQLTLAQALVTIHCDVILSVGPRELTPSAPDKAALQALYARLEFKTWLAELGTAPSPQTAPAALLTELPAIAAFVGACQHGQQVVLDLWAEGGEIIAIVVGAGAQVAVIPVRAELFAAVQTADALAALAPLFAHDAPPLVVHDGKRLLRLLMPAGLTFAGAWDDVMLASYVLDSGASSHDLQVLALKYLARDITTSQTLKGSGRERRVLRDLGSEELIVAATDTAQALLALHAEFTARLAKEPGLAHIYRDIERPLAAVLARVEANGVPIDSAMLKAQSAELAERLKALETQAYALAGRPFNLNSPAQIQEILFTEQRLPVKRRTPKGQPSTSEEVLAELALDYPLPQLILDYRGLGKLKSTYTDKLPLMCDPHTGRIHTDYHQAVAATGRLSSSDPNLQNIPIRTEEGRRIRQAFVAGPGLRLLSADYSQIELRLMAHLSADAGLVRAFREGRDIHRATAAEVFGTPLDAVTDDQRRAAKAINFGLMYGMSAFGLARQLHIDQGRAQDYCDLYFARYPGVHRYMEAMRVQAREQGYVETLFGRRLYIPDIKASHAARRQYAERTAINAPLQGTAADLIKMAMLAIDTFLTEAHLASRMIMQVHDELVFEGPLVELTVLQEAVVSRMEHVASLAVPLTVSCGVGKNWDEAH
ncbi:MAG TPA: DNA polymerase I [Acidiferrobacter sp.]|nr:DNA polymerase I [Acidiferrobacter sp.]